MHPTATKNPSATIDFFNYSYGHTKRALIQRKMAESYQEIEDRIDDAIDALNSAECPNISKTARKFDVPEQRLRRRFKGIQNKIQCGGKNRRLNEDQELVLCHYLDRLDESGVSTHPQML